MQEKKKSFALTLADGMCTEHRCLDGGEPLLLESLSKAIEIGF